MLRPDYPLTTERLELRPYTEADVDALHEIVRREDVSRFLYTGPMTREETVASVERRRRKVAIDDDNADIVLAATLRETDALIGSFLLRLVSREHRQGEIGYMLNPSHHGHGYATEGAARMLQLGFEWLELHRIVARLDARNDASARLAERLGMRREAHLRENEFVKGEWVDEQVYAILRTEWLNRRLPHRLARGS